VPDTSLRFRQTVVGSHSAVTRCRLLSTIQFGADPVGVDLPLLAGNVRLSASADLKATGTITVPGDYWDLVEPYGVEVFVERGVSFGDGTRELVPLGYMRIDKAAQQSRPYGPVVLDLSDRTVQMQQTRVIYPWQIPAATTHRAVVDALINGVESGVGTYGMYGPQGPTIPVDWTQAGYDPDTTLVGNDISVDDSIYDFLAKLIGAQGAMMRFADTGELTIVATEPAADALAVYTIFQGVNGTLVNASRSVSRTGVYNMVRATGSDPAYQTGYRLAYITEATNRLRWNGPFGPAVKYYASPVLKTSDAADAAAETVLAKSTGLPTETSLFTVPNPALRPLDKINAVVAGVQETHIIDEITVPLLPSDSSPLSISTRTTNPVGQVEVAQPTEPDLPDPEDPSGGGTTDPGGGGTDPGDPVDPNDGTQVAVARGWVRVGGDEYNYTGAPDPAKHGLYDGAGHGGNGRRTPAAWSVHDGMLTCHGDGNGNSGGLAFRNPAGVGYGYRIEVRARVYNTATDGGDRYHPVLILWPDSDQWPAGAEYDYFECDEGDASSGGFMHLPNHTPYRQDHFTISPIDIKVWHNYACEWNPAAQTLTQWTDGVQRYAGTGRVAQAPGPMHPTIQLDNFGGDPRSANFDIAWVRIYQRPNA
jgi:hypothetical protein